MSSQRHDTRMETAGMLAVAAATGAAFWIGEGLTAALPPFLLLLALTALVAVGRSRSDLLATMSGIGDERTRTNYQRAAAFAANVVSVFIVAWWLVTVAQGRPNETLALIAAVFGISWVVGVVFYARRG
jgi:hypothetical protein